ncbi:MAG TPA: hypothetical protein VFT87_00825 [Candidatus Saccharimonadales bacterium]|nr:hypothetical protein [Candidatus Saccharimonadales bacterium]
MSAEPLGEPDVTGEATSVGVDVIEQPPIRTVSSAATSKRIVTPFLAL